MPYIDLPPGLPGIRGLMAFRPETAEPLNRLADVLLHGPSTLSPGERELIASFVSARNECRYCCSIHGAVAAAHLDGDEQLVAAVQQEPEAAPISAKLRALLLLSAKVQEGGKAVTPDDVAHAHAAGATDLEIHDTVLIAAFFCLCNRYVDGLGTTAPDGPEFYRERGQALAQHGYWASTKALTAP